MSRSSMMACSCWSGRPGHHASGCFRIAADIHLDAEDSLALKTRAQTPAPAGVRTAIVRFPHLSNATDFRLLNWADWIVGPSDRRLRFHHPAWQQEHDCGSELARATSAWPTGFSIAAWLGTRVIGICGGFQMLGRRIDDPTGIESDLQSAQAWA